MLETDGYPFKSKEHSRKVAQYQRTGIITPYLKNYMDGKVGKLQTLERSMHSCPKSLLYQFSESCKLRISDKCCDRFKKKPFHEYEAHNNKMWRITGIMAEEGGQRAASSCVVFSKEKSNAFNPLFPVSKDWEKWFINSRNIKLCPLYTPPTIWKELDAKVVRMTSTCNMTLTIWQRHCHRSAVNASVSGNPCTPNTAA